MAFDLVAANGEEVALYRHYRHHVMNVCKSALPPTLQKINKRVKCGWRKNLILNSDFKVGLQWISGWNKKQRMLSHLYHISSLKCPCDFYSCRKHKKLGKKHFTVFYNERIRFHPNLLLGKIAIVDFSRVVRFLKLSAPRISLLISLCYTGNR